MVYIAVTSASGAPGTTMAAVGMAVQWPADRPAVLIDADPNGGTVAAGIRRGTADLSRGLVPLIASSAFRRGEIHQELPLQMQPLPLTHAAWIRGVDEPRQSRGIRWESLAGGLREVPLDVIVDCGRAGLASEPAPLRDAADLLVLMVTPTLVSVRSAELRLREWRESTRMTEICVVVCGSGPYSGPEISAALRIPVAAVLPHDPRTAAVWSNGAEPDRRYSRSPLLKATRDLVTTLIATASVRRQQLMSSPRSNLNEVTHRA